MLSALGKAPSVGTPTLTSSTSTVGHSVLTETGAEIANVTATANVSVESSVVGQLLERDVGTTVKEAMTNAGETGAQEVLIQAQEVVTAMLEGKNPNPAAVLGAKQA